MFAPGKPIVPTQPAAISQAREAVQPRPAARRSRLIRQGAAVALVAVGLYAMLMDVNHVVSDNAIISAQLISLRSPVDGVVEAAYGKVGEPVNSGMQLAVIDNPRVDERPQAIAQLTLVRLQAALAASVAERATLQTLLEELNGRADRYRQALASRLSWQTSHISRQLAAKQLELEQAQRELRRKEALVSVVAQADIERAQTTVNVARQQMEALAQELASAEGMARSATAGVLIEPGVSADVAYSLQRADEVRLRLASTERTVAALEAEVAEADARLATEAKIFIRTKAAVVEAPTDGIIWRIAAAKGERIATGDLVAQEVDCRAVFLAVAVPQSSLPDIQVGGTVTFRLAGEQEERTGRVRTTTGEAAMQSESRLAAAPLAGTRPTGLVLVDFPSLPTAAGSCLVGRTAHVVLPAEGTSWIGWGLRWLSGGVLYSRPAKPAHTLVRLAAPS